MAITRFERIFAPDPNRIKIPGRTQVPQQQFLPQKSQSAAAFSQLGSDIFTAGGQLAQIGAQNQARDEDREVKARKVSLQEWIRDRTYGNDQTGIRGYLQDNGQAALDSQAQFERDLQQQIKQVQGTISNPRVQAGYQAVASGEAAAALDNNFRHVAAQRKIAEDATNDAEAATAVDLYVRDPSGPQAKVHMATIVGAAVEKMNQMGVPTNTKAGRDQRTNFVRARTSAVAFSAIDKLLKENRTQEARELFADPDIKALMTTDDLGKAAKLVRLGNVTEEAQIGFQTLITNPDLKTEGKMIAEAKKKYKGDVEEKMIANIQKHFAAVARDRRLQEDNLRQSAVAKAQNGFLNAQGEPDPLTVQEQAEVARHLGMWERLQKIAITKISGRPVLSNEKVKTALYEMRRKDPEKFMNLNYGEEPYLTGLSSQDRTTFEGLSSSINRSAARKETTDKKAFEKGRRLNTALSGARSVIAGFFTSEQKDEKGVFEDRFTIEIERLSDLGVKFEKDSQYRDIARSLYIQGEATGRSLLAWFGGDDPNVKAFQQLAKGEAFNIEDFADTQDAKDLTTNTGFPSKTVQGLVAEVVGQGFVPTADVLMRQNVINTAGTSADEFRRSNKRFITNMATATSVSPANAAAIIQHQAKAGVRLTPKTLQQIFDRITAAKRAKATRATSVIQTPTIIPKSVPSASGQGDAQTNNKVNIGIGDLGEKQAQVVQAGKDESEPAPVETAQQDFEGDIWSDLTPERVEQVAEAALVNDKGKSGLGNLEKKKAQVVTKQVLEAAIKVAQDPENDIWTKKSRPTPAIVAQIAEVAKANDTGKRGMGDLKAKEAEIIANQILEAAQMMKTWAGARSEALGSVESEPTSVDITDGDRNADANASTTARVDVSGSAPSTAAAEPVTPAVAVKDSTQKPPKRAPKREATQEATRKPGAPVAVASRNNPGNIRASSTNDWLGKTGTKNGFETFDTPENGVRAIGVLLRTYQRKYKANTIAKIITRYAPPKENNTAKYIEFVEKASGVAANAVFSAKTNRATLAKVIAAMIRFEGSKDFDQDIIDRGLNKLFPKGS